MKKPKIPDNEQERLARLRSYQILDTLSENEFDEITQIASEICGTPIALISLVDKDRQWFKSRVGLDVEETSRDVSFCAHAIHEPNKVFEVRDSRADDRFEDNPLVVDSPEVIFYAGAPLVDPKGNVLGTLCVIDHKPNKLTDGQKASLKSLSRQVMRQLILRKENLSLERQKAYYQELIEDVDDYVFEVDGSGNFTYCSPQISKDTGFSYQELLSMNYLDLVHADDRERVEKFYLDEIKKKEGDSYIEFRLCNKDADKRELIIGQKSKTLYQGLKMKKIRAIARDITEQVAFKAEFEKNARLYQLISETTQEIVCLHSPEGVYTYVSPSITETLGYKPEEVIGLTPYDLMHPEDKERASKEAHEPLKDGAKQNYFEYRLRHKSGEYSWFESISASIQNEEGEVTSIRSTTRNIQVRKEQAEIISNQNSKLESFVLATPAPVAMLDNEVRYVAYSSQWLDTYGLHGKDIYGVSHYEIFPEIGEEWKAIHRECLAGKTHKRDEDSFEREDGSIQWIKWEVKPWYDRLGDIGGIIMLTEDITKLKEQELELRDAKEKAEIASEAKASFLSVMSHEIRTPLNAVIGMSHLLMQENPRKDQLQGLNIIRFSGENLLSIVNDILDYNKIEAGKVELENITFDLEELVDNIRHAHAFRAEENSVSLKLLYDKDLPAYVRGDSVRLSQIMNNLLSNAIKFTKEGSVRLVVEQVRRTDQEVTVYFEFKDTGIGISKENVEKIFDRFVQAESHISRNFGGTGLGLSITKRLLEAMGSQIEVSSRLGKGSVFSFELTLPISHDFIENLQGRISDSGLSSLASLGIRVLLVEDNPTNQLVANKFLTNWGLTVDIAVDGLEAVEMIQQKGYDLILMDLQMPKKDGLTACKEIRALEDEYFKTVPILALTASSDSETMLRVRNFGMNDVIVKPFNPSELHSKIVMFTKNVKGASKTLDSAIKHEVDIQAVKKKLLGLVSGDVEFVAGLLVNLIDNLDEFIESFPKSMEADDVTNAQFVLHKMKPTFKTCDLDEVMENARFCMATNDEKSKKEVLLEVVKTCQNARQSLAELKAEMEG